MGTEQLARNLAVLGAGRAPRDDAATPSLPPVVICREECEVVTGCVVGGEIGGEKKQTSRGRE